MRTLRKWQLLIVSAILLPGMSSCLKTSDPEFGIGIGNAYIYQVDNNFKPYLYFGSTRQGEFLKNAHVTNEIDEYPLNSIGYLQEIDIDASYTYPILTSIPTGVFTITASNAEGEEASASMKFNITEAQKMGELNVKSLDYDEKTGEITGAWDSVQNVTAYCLAVTPILKDELGLESKFEPGTIFQFWNAFDKKATSGKISSGLKIETGQKYRIAVAAISGEQFPNILIRRDKSFAKVITWK